MAAVLGTPGTPSGGPGGVSTTGPSGKPILTQTRAYDNAQAAQIGTRGPTRGVKGRGLNFKLIADVLAAEADLPDGFDLAQAIVDALKNPSIDVKTRLAAQLELLQYIEPKKKAIEHKGKIELDDATVKARLNYLLGKIGADPSGDRHESAVSGGTEGAGGPLEPLGEEEEA